MAAFSAIESGTVSPPTPAWLRAMVEELSKKLPAGWETKPIGNVWKEWLARMPSWDAPGSPLGATWLSALSKPLSGLREWGEKTQKLRELMPSWSTENPWLTLARFHSDSSVENFWGSAVVFNPGPAMEFAAEHPGSMGVLSWNALIDMKGLRDPDRWESESIQALLTLSKGSASRLDTTAFIEAVSKGSSTLVQALLEDGATPCDASTLWETVRRNRDAWQASGVLGLVKTWKEHCSDQPVLPQPVDLERLWKVVYSDFRATPDTIRGLVEAGVGLPSLAQLWGEPRGDGNELLRSMVRSQELGHALPVVEAERVASKPRF